MIPGTVFGLKPVVAVIEPGDGAKSRLCKCRRRVSDERFGAVAVGGGALNGERGVRGRLGWQMERVEAGRKRERERERERRLETATKRSFGNEKNKHQLKTKLINIHLCCRPTL